MERYVKLLADVNLFVVETLAVLSVACSKNPKKTILGFLTCCILLMLGVLSIEVENRTLVIWVDQNSIPKKDLEYVEATFKGESITTSYLIVSENDAPGVNILNKATFDEAFRFYEELLDQMSEEGSLTYEDLCIRAPNNECINIGPLKFWNYNFTFYNETVLTDDDVATACAQSTFPDGTTPVFDEIFGEYVVENGKASARALTETLLIKGLVDESEIIPESWIDAFLSFSNFDFESSVIDVAGFANKAVDDELNNAIFNDIFLIAIAFAGMILFMSLTLGAFGSALNGRAFIAFFDVIALIFSVGAAYGLMMAIGVPFTSLAVIAPFILLGIGIDNAYVIAQTFDATYPLNPIPLRVEETMLTAGMSITATSLSDFAALMLGSLTKIPAIKFFCYYTCTAIIFIYIQHLTVFVALMSLDAKRVLAGRRDCCPCCQVSDDAIASASSPIANVARRSLKDFMYEKYGPFILKPNVRLFVIVFFAILGGVSGYSISLITREFRLEDLVLDTSFVGEYFRLNENIYGASISVAPITYLYTKELNYSSLASNQEITRLTSEILQASCIDSASYDTSWHEAFHLWAATITNSSFEDGYYLGNDLTQLLQNFLEISQFERYKADLVFENNGTDLVASRIAFKHNLLATAPEQIDCLLEMQAIVQDSVLEPPPIILSSVYLYWDQYRIILPEMIQNLGLAVLAIVLVSTVFLIFPGAVLIMAIVLISTFTWLLAILPFWGLDLNSISAVNLIMAIGLVVDYSLHIIHSFVFQDGISDRSERVLVALREIGSPVLMGLLTTFLGILPVAFASSQVFRVFFYMLLSIVVVGGLHGLVLLPVLLSMAGPIPKKNPLEIKVVGIKRKTAAAASARRSQGTLNEAISP